MVTAAKCFSTASSKSSNFSSDKKTFQRIKYPAYLIAYLMRKLLRKGKKLFYVKEMLIIISKLKSAWLNLNEFCKMSGEHEKIEI